jgi:hypothetical protein
MKCQLTFNPINKERKKTKETKIGTFNITMKNSSLVKVIECRENFAKNDSHIAFFQRS